MKKYIISLCGIFIVLSIFFLLNKDSWIYKDNPTTARVDMLEYATKDAPCFDVMINNKKQSKADHLAKNGNQGYVTEYDGKRQHLELLIKRDNCKINFILRGIWDPIYKDNPSKGLIKHWVEYTNFSINGKEIIAEPVAVWHNKPFRYSITTDKGDKLNIDLKYKKYYVPQSMEEKGIIYIICIALLIAGYFLIWQRKYIGGGIGIAFLFTALTIKLLDYQEIKVNIYGFVILVTSYFLFTYKLGKYLSRFKIEEHHPRIDIVFLTVFFILLFVPMLHISDAEKSEQENRMLAKYTPLIDYRGGYNLKYGKNFDAWFSDRFWGRDELVKVYYKIKKINRYIITAKASKLKNDWYFNNYDLSTLTISEKQKVQYKKNIQYLLQFCKENNIKCYMEIVPAKIYYAKDGLINNKLKEYNDTLPQFIKYIKETLNFEIIYPLDELKEADKSDYVYFKTDHHWTDWGAYIGYQALLKQLKKDFPDIYEAKEGDFDISYSKKVRAEADRKYWQGHTCNLLHQNQDCSLNIDYKYYDGKNKHINAISYGEFHNSDGKYKALLIGNSFTENFKPFLVYSFKDIKRFRCNIAPNDNLKLSRWKKEILEFKPDVLILLFQEGYTDKLRTIKD